MSEPFVRAAITGGDNPTVDVATQIGTFATRLGEIADEMGKAKDADTARWQTLNEERVAVAAALGELKTAHEKAKVDAATADAIAQAASEQAYASTVRTLSKAGLIGTMPGLAPSLGGYEKGSFLTSVFMAAGRDYDMQAAGKAEIAKLAAAMKAQGDAKAALREDAWGDATIYFSKSTLGATDATGGWIIPNAIVDEFIAPAAHNNIYEGLCTVVPGVLSAAVDMPFRSGVRSRALIAAFGATKENRDLAYNGYTATMYTLAAIYDLGNQFLRQSRGAAENDVMSELAAAFSTGQAYYVREGSGSSEPFGYTSALTNGPATFRSTFSPAATLVGSISAAIATAAGALAGRGVGDGGRGLAAVLAATSYWTMLAEGTDTAGFFFNPSSGPTAINAPAGTLITPFGIPVYPDSTANDTGTAAVLDNLVVGDWKKFKIYRGQNYRVDSSDQAGTRWDTNLTGFRGELEMGFDARPAVYSGHFQMITDILP